MHAYKKHVLYTMVNLESKGVGYMCLRPFKGLSNIWGAKAPLNVWKPLFLEKKTDL